MGKTRAAIWFLLWSPTSRFFMRLSVSLPKYDGGSLCCSCWNVVAWFLSPVYMGSSLNLCACVPSCSLFGSAAAWGPASLLSRPGRWLRGSRWTVAQNSCAMRREVHLILFGYQTDLWKPGEEPCFSLSLFWCLFSTGLTWLRWNHPVKTISELACGYFTYGLYFISGDVAVAALHSLSHAY